MEHSDSIDISKQWEQCDLSDRSGDIRDNEWADINDWSIRDREYCVSTKWDNSTHSSGGESNRGRELHINRTSHSKQRVNSERDDNAFRVNNKWRVIVHERIRGISRHSAGDKRAMSGGEWGRITDMGCLFRIRDKLLAVKCKCAVTGEQHI